MSQQQGPLECADDGAPFDATATCLGCRRPVHHHAPTPGRHAAFAGGIELPDGRYQQLAIVCDKCITEPILERCVWEARRRSGNPSQVRYHYQRVGTPEAQATLLAFVTGLHR